MPGFGGRSRPENQNSFAKTLIKADVRVRIHPDRLNNKNVRVRACLKLLRSPDRRIYQEIASDQAKTSDADWHQI